MKKGPATIWQPAPPNSSSRDQFFGDSTISI
jgi:hypothetical protein